MRNPKEKSKVASVVEAVVAFLPGYTCDPPHPEDGYTDHCHNATGPNGQRLHFQYKTWGHDEGKMEISGWYPPRPHGSILEFAPKDQVTIGVSSKNKPERIAADIQRRLLPSYIAGLAEEKKNFEAADSALKRKDAIMFDLAAGMNVEHTPRDGKFSIHFDGSWQYSDIDVEVKCYSDSVDSVKLTLDHMKPDQARALLAWARANLPGAKQPAEKSR